VVVQVDELAGGQGAGVERVVLPGVVLAVRDASAVLCRTIVEILDDELGGAFGDGPISVVQRRATQEGFHGKGRTHRVGLVRVGDPLYVLDRVGMADPVPARSRGALVDQPVE
jgi:hypothetical protein